MSPLTLTTRYNSSSNLFCQGRGDFSRKGHLLSLFGPQTVIRETAIPLGHYLMMILILICCSRSPATFTPGTESPYPPGGAYTLSHHTKQQEQHMTTSGNDRVQEGMRQTGERWLRVRRALKKEEQAYADRLAAMIRSHTDDQFATIGDPLEAAMLSVFIELLKMIRSEKRGLQTEMVDTAEGDAAAEGQNRG